MVARSLRSDLRMGACVQIILVLIAASLLDQVLGIDPKCNQDFLFAVSQERENVGLSLFFDKGSSYISAADAQNHQQITLNEQQLSSQCGENSFRCKDPLTITTKLNATTIQYLYLIPLEDNLLIQEVLQTSATVKFGKNYLLSTSNLLVQYRCSPIKAFFISLDYYLVCSDIQRNYISFHRIFLDKNTLSSTTLSVAPIAKFHTQEDMQTLSNPLYVEEELVYKIVYFSVGNSMYGFDVVAFGGDQIGNVGLNCTHVQELQYTGNLRILAYCKFTNVLYSIQYEDWDIEYWNEDDGVPFPCSNGSILLRVFTVANYLHYSINKLVGNVDLLGDGFTNGVCFGAAKQPTIFVYSDLNTVYMINMETFENVEVMSTGCTAPGCLSIEVVDDRYLVIHEDSQDKNMYIFDARENFTNLIKEEHFTSLMYKYVTDVDLECVIVHNSSTNDSVIVSPTYSPSVIPPLENIAGPVAGTLVAFLVFVVLIVSGVFLMLKYRKKVLNFRPTIPIIPLHSPTQATDEDQDSTPLTEILKENISSGSSPISADSKSPRSPLNLLPGGQVNNNNANTSPISATNTTAPQKIVGNASSEAHQMSSIHQCEESGTPPAPESKSPSLALGTSGASNWPLSNTVPDHIGVTNESRNGLPKLELLENSFPDNEKRDCLTESTSTPSVCDDKALLLPRLRK